MDCFGSDHREGLWNRLLPLQVVSVELVACEASKIVGVETGNENCVYLGELCLLKHHGLVEVLWAVEHVVFGLSILGD